MQTTLRLSLLLICAALLGGAPVCAQDGSRLTATTPYNDAFSVAAAADRNHDLAPALLGYVAAINAASSPSETSTASSALYQMITGYGMPHLLTTAQLSKLQAAPGPFTLKSVDNGVTLLGIDGRASRSLDNVSDPQNQWPFPALVAVYTPGAGDPSQNVLVCSVHYQSFGDEEFAGRVGRLLALLRSVLMRRTGQAPAFESPFHVWLSRSAATTPGGEQWRNNVYLYNIADGRSSIEWIREIAHEYSHLAFPPLGGEYTAPEAWANGYAGERLLVRWLAVPALAGADKVQSVWGKTFNGYANFQAKLIDPPLATFQHVGLSSAWLARRDENGMRYLIGLLLWVDRDKGGHALGDLLWNMETPNPSSLYDPVKKLGAPGAVH